ncbi:hypothetical protein CHRY9390_03069 [Chryseobacterium aquaeductus]|uniref:Uncharacterized protein n=1 Tax=Chryseobacterium aquaeductus TaxID=2675056 RepID=A0A9N8MQU0_9FLAO|nr:hypothetical protein [Chryseobacterium aquaeductus]CAA7332347.1 hypothetical protein CHRY9390_03069 [Chryseobacterium potabilaquae]CAD7815943.1 hypothetical protein CHRY9390_03069 [Chryseobacterium aquaeductus]
MIHESHINNIERYRRRALVKRAIPYFVFILTFLLAYYLKFKYSESTNLFNDKLIDVCSIFFGIFIGCLYLFEKFRSNETYSEFLKFCKILLYQNLIVIAFSFIIILTNDNIPKEEIKILNCMFDIRALVFSLYVALFAVVLQRIFIFIKIILKVLRSIRQS